jgi:hypothetical protein
MTEAPGPDPRISRLVKTINSFQDSLLPIPEDISFYNVAVEDLVTFQSHAAQLLNDFADVGKRMKAELETEEQNDQP